MSEVRIVDQEPLDTIDPSRADRFADESIHQLFCRLRREAPVHYCHASEYGPFWSITRYADIKEIELQPEIFSSALPGGVSLNDPAATGNAVSFVQMDPPEHTRRRMVLIQGFTPAEMTRLSQGMRDRTKHVLDALPRGEVFDWVERVSVRLTMDMLAILLDFPWEDRSKLGEWTEWIASIDLMRNRPDERRAKLAEMAAYFMRLWTQRANADPGPDLISRMAHSDALGNLDPMEFLGTLGALVFAGNDTSRNTMSGLVVAFGHWPEEWRKVCENEALFQNAMLEVIRWQTPSAYMRRTVTRDLIFREQSFKKGDMVVLWYLSANRDEAVFAEGGRYIADRGNVREHLSFGHGVHRCIGARLAETQVQILMSEMIRRDLRVELAGDVVRRPHPHISQIDALPVRIKAA